MSRATLLLGCTLALALFLFQAETEAGLNRGTDSPVELAVPAPTESFTVAILGDLTGGEESGLAVLERAVAEINLLQPDLAVHVGDLVPGYIRDMRRWEQDILRVKGILDRLEAPLFVVAGNHDVITGTGDTEDRRGEALFKRCFGPLYYSFDYHDAHFVFLYTDEALESSPRFSNAQLDWLRRDLDGTAARQVFVFMHKPLWEYPPEAGWEKVHALLHEHPVRAVFAGHFHHYYKSQKRDGIQYYAIGVTGGQRYSPELAGGLEHYCMLNVRPDDYRLALVKPGRILADDYIACADFKAMERLRFLLDEEAGVSAAVRSPELGAVEDQVAVAVTNPLDRPLVVTVRGIAGKGPWSFDPVSTSLLLQPGERHLVHLGIHAPRVSSGGPAAPEVEIQYTYEDSKGRTIPIVLRRRVPLRREVKAALGRPAISVDGRADEAAWQRAPALTTAVWQTSPYETGEPGPFFRIIPTVAGVYLYAESMDEHISDFRGERMLSDALFVGAVSSPGDYAGADLAKLPVVVVYPFEQGRARAVQAFWDARRPVGFEVSGVHVATVRKANGKGWRCEGFVPWDALLVEAVQPGQDVRFNVGAWDNDGSLFTELHSWAPTSSAALWGRLKLSGSE